MEREQPWLRPDNALEELLYKGIIYRAYGNIGEYYGEVFVIPQQLLERLPKVKAGSPQRKIERAEIPLRIKADGRALIEDLFAILVRVRQGQVRAPKHKPALLPQVFEQMNLAARLVGENHPERLALIWQLLWRLCLICEERGILQPSLKARDWLRSTDRERLQSVYLAWRDAPHWNELRLLPSLRLEDTGWQNEPIIARRNLLTILAECPPSIWLSLDSLVQTIRSYYPDYLRPDGDFDSWYIRDTETGDYLRGLESWDKIEGTLARYIIAQPLCWLGIVNIGYGEDDKPMAFCITEKGKALLARVASESAGQRSAEVQSPKTEVPLVTVSDDFVVTIPTANTLYERYQLERFAEWQAQTAPTGRQEQATYRITAESVWRSQKAGVKTEQIMNFLGRISQGQLPPTVLQTLGTWEEGLGRVFIREAILLRTVDERTMQQLDAHPEIRALLGETLSPTMRLVDKEHLDDLSERLKALGLWPHIKI